MKYPIFKLAAFGLLAVVLHAESDNQVVLDIPSTKEHPRNSEGAFATLKSGRIIFYYGEFYSGDADESLDRVMEIHSDDQGRTWSKGRPVFERGENLSLMDFSILRLDDGRLAMIYGLKKNIHDCRPNIRFSSDEGATWSEGKPIFGAPGYFAFNNDRLIQTSKGRLIMPVAYMRLHSEEMKPGSNDERGSVLWYLSDDRGATWREGKSWWGLPVASINGLQEPGVVEAADGSIYSWARTDVGTQYEFRSRDGGETFSAPEPGDLVSTLTPASVKRLPNSGTLMAIFNDRTGLPIVHDNGLSHRFVRTPLTAGLSTDNGATWPFRKTIESDPAGEFCYTAIHFVGDSVLLAYSAGDPSLAHLGALRIRRIALSWLPPTAPRPGLKLPPEPYSATKPDNSRYYDRPELLGPCEDRVAAAQCRPCNIIFIGDSITANWLNRASWLWTTRYAERGALDFGIGGDKTQNVVWRLQHMNLTGLRPKVAVIMIGTNNLANTVPEIAEGVKAVLAKTRQTFPGIKVILVSILPNKRANAKMMEVNAIIKGYADGRVVQYLDLVPLMPPVGDNWKGLGPDYLHPVAGGYRIWADAMEPMLETALAKVTN